MTVLSTDRRRNGWATSTPSCRYLSALGWDVELGEDQLHPTAAGHRAFGEQVAAALAP
ncbi:MAG TPA: hypothetical protein VFV32_01040 [Acidimicrobiales bacterium]|nr:hypothetical protein [Acidimicrobiales bacterium]